MPSQNRYGAFRVCLLLITLSLIAPAAMPAADVSAAADSPAYPDVAAIFREKCTVCHSGDGAPKGLRLDS
ncbi:MAG: hypothetical protein GTO00_04195, partial [Deltaproteobacteria bacterium]|nr:hypothetical protein [Deltaproteobacteria bacterium]